MRFLGHRVVAGGLALAIAASMAIAPPADAKDKHRKNKRRGHSYEVRYRDRDWGRASWGYRRAPVRYVVVRRPRAVIVRPAYVDHFVVHRPRFVVVRPVPYWPMAYGDGVSARIGIRTGGVNLNVGFNKRSPYYGCNFCDDYFTSYSSWERHVGGCSHSRYDRVIAEPWDQDDLGYFRNGASDAWDRHCHEQGRDYDDDRYWDD